MRRRTALTGIALALASVTASGCSKDDPETLLEDASFGRRIFRPPPADEVRAVPPHNIHRKGVGPYELDASLQETLELLPSGPRLELFEAKGLFDYRVMRSEQDALVIGARRGKVDFISVLDPDIARTESGVGVGAGVSELVIALGELRGPQSGARDPRIVTFSALPSTRFIVERGKVVAAISQRGHDGQQVEPSEEGTPQVPGLDAGIAEAEVDRCQADALAESRDKLLALAKMSDKAVMRTSCVLSKKGEALLREGERLVLVSAEGGKPRLAGSAQVEDMDFAFLHKNGTGKAAVFVVSQKVSPAERSVEFRKLKVEGPTLGEEWVKTPMSLAASTAKWIGASVDKADFLIEVSAGQGTLELGGIFVHRSGGRLRNVVPLEPVVIPIAAGRPSKKPKVEEPGQGASGQAPDSASPLPSPPSSPSAGSGPKKPTTP